MKYIKFFSLVLLIAIGIGSLLFKYTSSAQVISPTGRVNLQSSQLVFWYDNTLDAEERTTTFQLTNTGPPVAVHVQAFENKGVDGVQTVFCQERDFTDFYTTNDTHLYIMTLPILFVKNKNCAFQGSLIDIAGCETTGINLQNSKGFIVVTPVVSETNLAPISHQFLFGTSTIIALEDEDDAYRISAMGRDAVSFVDGLGLPLPQGTILNGVTGGYEVLQPDVVKWDFDAIDIVDDDADELEFDIISISFKDSYSSIIGGYSAEPGAVVWDTLIFNDNEIFFSCDAKPQNCFFDYGLSADLEGGDTELGDVRLCDLLEWVDFVEDDDEGAGGWIRTEVSGYDPFENEIGIVGLINEDLEDTEDAPMGASYMYVEGERFVPPTPTPSPTPVTTPTPTPTPCLTDDECDPGQVCEDGFCEDGCKDDDDCPPGQVCEDFVEPDLGQCVPTPTPGGGGGGGGCSLASPVQLGTAMANILIPLIPAIGIGFRMIRRRKGSK